MKNVITLNLGSGYEYSIRPYLICTTEADTQTKYIDCNDNNDLNKDFNNDFNIVDGATIAIKFTKGNTYVGNTDDGYNIKFTLNNKIKEMSTDCDYVIPENGIQEFIYDNDTWRAIGKPGEASTKDIKDLFKK